MANEAPSCDECGDPMTWDGLGWVCLCQLRKQAGCGWMGRIPLVHGIAPRVKCVRNYGFETNGKHTFPLRSYRDE